jgi:hypothetical protein
MGKVRKGVGKLVADCSQPPIVLPFVHSGMEGVMPKGARAPAVGKGIRVLVGEPVEVADLLAAAAQLGWSRDELYTAVSNRVRRPPPLLLLPPQPLLHAPACAGPLRTSARPSAPGPSADSSRCRQARPGQARPGQARPGARALSRAAPPQVGLQLRRLKAQLDGEALLDSEVDASKLTADDWSVIPALDYGSSSGGSELMPAGARAEVGEFYRLHREWLRAGCRRYVDGKAEAFREKVDRLQGRVGGAQQRMEQRVREWRGRWQGGEGAGVLRQHGLAPGWA